MSNYHTKNPKPTIGDGNALSALNSDQQRQLLGGMVAQTTSPGRNPSPYSQMNVAPSQSAQHLIPRFRISGPANSPIPSKTRTQFTSASYTLKDLFPTPDIPLPSIEHEPGLTSGMSKRRNQDWKGRIQSNSLGKKHKADASNLKKETEEQTSISGHGNDERQYENLTHVERCLRFEELRARAAQAIPVDQRYQPDVEKQKSTSS